MAERQRQKPVILVANLKGGVGKSTLVANLAAYFREAGKRVIVIDGDYQGSLSNMLLAADGCDRAANLLLSNGVADEYDIALIDAPPRLTAATINGFCASTHLLVPTVYDKMSAEAVGTFLHGVRTLKSALNTQIDLLGVVGTLTHRQDSLV